MQRTTLVRIAALSALAGGAAAQPLLTEVAEIQPSFDDSSSQFGWAVVASGSKLAVSAPLNIISGSNTGRMLVYDAATLQLEQTLQPDT
ncbi:MAG: hypothetical protein AAFN41_10195, partial [Planctomycetota bacterium]